MFTLIIELLLLAYLSLKRDHVEHKESSKSTMRPHPPVLLQWRRMVVYVDDWVYDINGTKKFEKQMLKSHLSRRGGSSSEP